MSKNNVIRIDLTDELTIVDSIYSKNSIDIYIKEIDKTYVLELSLERIIDLRKALKSIVKNGKLIKKMKDDM